MNERDCLQKIRDLGVRLQELDLARPQPGKSYTSVALDFLFHEHKLERPTGAPLEHTLRTLGLAVMERHQLKFQRLDASAIIDYFCRFYRVH